MQKKVIPPNWRENTLGDIYTERKEPGNDSLPVLSVSIHSGVSDGELGEEELGKKIKRIEDKSQYRKAMKGDLVFNMMRAWQGAIGVVRTDGQVSPAYIVAKPNEKVYPPFMDYYMKTPRMIHSIHRQSYGVTDFRLRLYWDSFAPIPCMIPPVEEQKKIAEILAVQDRIITLYGQKIEQLRLLKKYCLQKMFPKRGSNVPEVRFPGFTNPWEQRKLSAIVDRITRKNDGLQSSLPLTISAQYGLVDQITYFNKRVASQNVADYYLIKKGEFAYNKSTSESFPFGAIKRLDLYDMGVLSTLYIVFSLRPNLIDSDYMVTYFETDLWHKQISERAEEGARNHGLLNITADDFFDISLLTPCSIDEQKQIGNYFKRLDELILLYQRKRGQETEKKKTLMQLLLSGTIRVNNIGGII